MLQDSFQEKYNIDWYENWFYSLTTGLLTFSTGETQINFRFFYVGSFSGKSSTWKWAWDNDSIPDKAKVDSRLIKEFGQRENFPKFTEGFFPSDEIEAWEFTAIAVKLANGIGAYRPVNDNHLQIFLVVTEFVDNETAQDIKDKYIECASHQYQRIAFVCKHLIHNTKVGFVEAFETFEGMELADDDDLQAWCHACEVVRQQEGEWNAKSQAFAGIRLICEKCYFEMKELNLKPGNPPKPS